MVAIRTLLLGACGTHGAIGALMRAGRRELVLASVSAGGSVPGVYTFGEMFQVLALLRGELELPAEIMPLCGVAPSFAPHASLKWIDNVDLALIEPASPDELIFRGFHINLANLITLIYEPIKALGPECAREVYSWYQKGLRARDVAAQLASAERIVAMLPDEFPNRPLVIDVLRETYVEATNIRNAISRLKAEIDRPIGIVTYTFGFMPDGRPIHWPALFVETVLAASAEFNFPVMEPWRLVQTHGISAALERDLRHYSQQFLPVVADALIAFARDVLDVSLQSERGLMQNLSEQNELGQGTEGVQQKAVSVAARSTSVVDVPVPVSEGTGPVVGDTASCSKYVNFVLIELHRSRVAALGVDESGLYRHYKGLLDADTLVHPYVTAAATLVADGLPEFNRYDVLRAGLGELAFILALRGLSTLAYESNPQRFDAMRAGLAGLTDALPDIGHKLRLENAAIPHTTVKGSLCIARELIGYREDQEREVLACLSQYDALLIQPRFFLWHRSNLADQRAAVEAIGRCGFTTLREFPELELMYCAKPKTGRKRVISVHNELPAVTGIVNALRSVPLDHMGCHYSPALTVAVRDFPFPFTSALAVSTGVEWESSKHALQMRNFICGRGETAYGTGLGIEVGSAFTFRESGGIHGAFGVADPETAIESEAAIIDLARSGWIDTIRNAKINEPGRRILDRLANAGVQPCVGIDVEGKWPAGRFVSGRRLLETEKFGEHLNYGGQNAWTNAIQVYPWEQWKGLMPADTELLASRFNAVLQSPELDGDMLSFKRFNGTMRSTWTTFPSQVTSMALDSLERGHGAIVVDVEAATWSLVGACWGNDRARPLRSEEMFDLHAIECWSEIAARRHENRLLVATVSRLLDWLWRRSHISVTTEYCSDKWVLTLSLGATGEVGPIAQLLDGLALSVPEDAPEICVTIAGHSSIPEFRRAPDPGWPKRHALYRPWSFLAWPGK